MNNNDEGLPSPSPEAAAWDDAAVMISLAVMNMPYNRIAGQSVERLAALSDGIFAVAMTLLVLELRLPAVQAIHSERYL